MEADEDRVDNDALHEVDLGVVVLHRLVAVRDVVGVVVVMVVAKGEYFACYFFALFVERRECAISCVVIDVLVLGRCMQCTHLDLDEG